MTESELSEFRANARTALLAERTPEGHWVGELSASALSTATALFTLSLQGGHAELVHGGLEWLKTNQNADGGWGDTILSFSNLSTTCLCWAAFSIDEAKQYEDVQAKAEAWIAQRIESPPIAMGGSVLARKIADSYGKDRTFSVPILTMLALAERMPWKHVPQLPFELAAIPFRFFQVIRLPVVSYALPALIAIGQAKHAKRPSWNPFIRVLRSLVKHRTLRKLREIQPSTGGYLEATPLTSFVVMSLIGVGNRDSPVVGEGVRFLVNSVRPDGSWPIDTNLTTWVTTLAINSLSSTAPLMGEVDSQSESGGGSETKTTPHPSRLHRADLPLKGGGVGAWLLAQQYRSTHPFTQAAPGGWAWTDLPGGVPDADDTPGALIALRNLGEPDETAIAAASAGVAWLLDLQNRDGGIPTFCKGWTGLPFDRSSNDLTAHTLRAWWAWHDQLSPELQQRVEAETALAIQYLLRTQNADGSWAPLWFGNQHSADVANLTYGTSRVLKLAELPGAEPLAPAFERATAWLRVTQNADGGWGGRENTPSSIEETALALEGLLAFAHMGHGTFIQPHWRAGSVSDRSGSQEHPPVADAPGSPVWLDECFASLTVRHGLDYLDRATQRGTRFPPSPIGFYFANLWYFEKLYPIIFTVAALERVR